MVPSVAGRVAATAESWRPASADERGILGAFGDDRGVGFAGARRIDIEQVADALEGLDPAGLAGLGAELAADARDPDPQVLEVVAVLRAPDLGQQLGVEDDLAGVRGEVLEEQPLRAGQLDELAVRG